jgi:hypothetical protein
LKLYGFPANLIFNRSLHFIAAVRVLSWDSLAQLQPSYLAASSWVFVFWGASAPGVLVLKAWPLLRIRCSGALAETNFLSPQCWEFRGCEILLQLIAPV